jgi:diguanylate cyclase (GGDEF)-like protein/PAS domain S-box-containing protein
MRFVCKTAQTFKRSSVQLTKEHTVMMRQSAHRVLLIDNDQAAVTKIRKALADSSICSFVLESVSRLSEGLTRLGASNFSGVLVDLSLPDSRGLITLERLIAAAPHIPILIVSDIAHEAIAIKAVARGAYDYLLPNHLNEYALPRALNHAIEREAVQDELYAEKERALVTLNSIGDAVLSTDISGHVIYLNVVAEHMTGWSRKDATGRLLGEVFQIVDGTTREVARNPLEMAVEQNRTVGLTSNCILIRRDGTESPIEDSAAPIHDRTGAIIGAVIVFHDVSAARAMSLQMTYAAHHDLVTDLPNRLLLGDRIRQSIALAQRQHESFAVLFLDLDHFKTINDSLGHAIGDKVLQSIGKRLQTSLRSSDTVSRQGGDEFVILLPGIVGPSEAAKATNKLQLALSAPHRIEGHLLHVNGSIGISIYPEDGDNAESLIQNADIAMYHAKESGRNTFQFFTAEMNRKAVERQSLEVRLRSALKTNEFVLHYQPRIDLKTGEITGCEALIRWNRGDDPIVFPDQFIPVAEECNLIIPIGRWVIREACRQGRSWQEAGLRSLPLSVNISAVEFMDKGFVEGIREILSDTGMEARFLELELTEGVLMKDPRMAAVVLMQLKEMGLHLAVDDFGTGYSSLSYLRQFPIDVLKIDRTFVQQISKNPEDSVLVDAIIQMGKSLRLTVVAEGVETEQQRTYLQGQNCAEGQGYLLGRPLEAGRIVALLAVRELDVPADYQNRARPQHELSSEN